MIEYTEPTPVPEGPIVRAESIFGMLPMVTTTPTWTPKTFIQGLAIDTSASKMYYYDFTNKAWKRVGGEGAVGVYAGKVVAAANANTLPSSWTAGVSGSNVYTVTHNLGSSAYMVVATAIGTSAEFGTFILLQLGISANNFQVQFSTTGGVTGTTDWVFTLVPIT